ncbi:MAG: ornithine carbamoyltransferase [Thermoplasmata archaeon]|nr:MAG: ornithine carbamoyltransferase [Thermoplasmata archaeon]RLF71006.1 MAG: ornithine carbamoyltransferase [Thermoplasmata archaeon]
MKRDIISMLDLEDDLMEFLELARRVKEEPARYSKALEGKSLGMIFEKPSTRTRVSFEVAMTQLGGHGLYLSTRDLQLGRGETVEDTAKVLSRYVDGIIYRGFSHQITRELARHSTVPVINALDDAEHPMQILADLLTVLERKGDLRGLKLAYIGDGNNVANSLALGAAMVGMHFVIACPEGYDPDENLWREAERLARERGGKVEIVRDPLEAARGADAVYTDVWVSMGDEEERDRRLKVFRPYQVTVEVMERAKEDAIFMHCLPAHRGEEVAQEVIDGRWSVVFDQAENRLHAQKAALLKLLS